MKRILSVALALLLVFGILPVANAAALFDPNGQEQVLGSDGGDTVCLLYTSDAADEL